MVLGRGRDRGVEGLGGGPAGEMVEEEWNRGIEGLKGGRVGEMVGEEWMGEKGGDGN